MATGFQQTVEAVPAYGRDYKSQKAVKEAWDAGEDFQDAFTGQYFSKRDEGFPVMIRYAKLMKVFPVRS